MSHYWTASDAPEVRKHQMGDWLDDLSEFPAAIVADACRDWRQSETRRPSPAEIRTRCISIQRDRRGKPSVVALPGNAQASYRLVQEEKKRVFREAAEAREAWAKDHGCQSFKQAMDIGLQLVGKRQPPNP